MSPERLHDEGQVPCFCGQPNDRDRVHRSHACEPWVTTAARGDAMTLHDLVARTQRDREFVADVLHDCLSSFQGLDHTEGVCCFDREAAVEYLLSPASGLRIEVES